MVKSPLDRHLGLGKVAWVLWKLKDRKQETLFPPVSKCVRLTVVPEADIALLEDMFRGKGIGKNNLPQTLPGFFLGRYSLYTQKDEARCLNI